MNSKIVLPIFLMFIAVGLFMYFTNPIMNDIDGLRAQLVSYDEALGNSRKLIAMRETLLKKKNSFNQDSLSRAEKMLPDSIDNVRLIIDLSEIAKKYSMDVRNIRVTSQGSKSAKDVIGPDSKKYDALGLAFSVSGPYDTFRAFLGDLERSLRLIDVVSVSFTAAEKDFYDYNVEIRTYWLK